MKQRFIVTKVLVVILTIAATVMLDSCVRTEIIIPNKNKIISFSANIGTKAQETELAQLDSFNVYAYAGSAEYFDDVFRKDPTANPVEFKSIQPHYWPASGRVDFEVFFPTDLDYKKDNHKIAFVTNSAIHNQVDFIAGETFGNKLDNEFDGVGLDMFHKLAQIRLYASCSCPGRKVEIQKLALNNIKGSGDYCFGGTEWNNLGSLSSYELELSPACVLDGDTGNTVAFLTPASSTIGAAMFIPQEFERWAQKTDSLNTTKKPFLSMLVKVTDRGTCTYPTKKCSAEYAWLAIPFEVDLQPGHAYTFNLNFDDGLGFVHPGGALLDGKSMGQFDPGEKIIDTDIAVQFNVTQIDWDADDEEYIIIYELDFAVALYPWNEVDDRGEWNNDKLFPKNPNLENWYDENEEIWKIVYPND